MENAGAILDEVKRDWRGVEEIVRAVATKFACEAGDVREGVEAVFGELAGQWFVEVETTGKVDENDHEVCPTASIPEGQVDDWTPLGGFYQRHGLPSELHLDLTDGCNERCVHCYLPKGGAHFLDTGIALKVLKEFREAQGLTVFISGGECMLHRDFEAILRRARELELNIVVMSNLTLCNWKMVALLKEVEPQFVNVSLYAVSESIHDGITQVQGSCRKTKTAMDVLLAAGVPVRIATPFMKENKGCVEELKAFARKRRIHLIPDAEIFGPIDHSCSNRNHALSLAELETLVAENKEVFAKGCAEPERCVPDAKVCDIGDARLNLDAEGRYYPCDGFHGAIIGDARKDSLWEVWMGEALNRLRALKNRDFGECAACADRAWCKVCPMRNFNETGDMFRHAPWRCGAAKVYRRIFEEQGPC
jgi:radical SAM protein with 4Fe4S-binding SPASM domain